MVNRILGDLEFRGAGRPVTKEFNLAANHGNSNENKAEFRRTLDSTTFSKAELLQREELCRAAMLLVSVPMYLRKDTQIRSKKIVDSTSSTRNEDDAQQKSQNANATVAANSCGDRISQDDAMPYFLPFD